jgi:hypothetical protein
VLLVCLASLAKAVVGVAGGATRAALTQHQARCNNTGDVSAKDGSQERLVNLAGLLVAYAVTRAMADPDHTAAAEGGADDGARVAGALPAGQAGLGAPPAGQAEQLGWDHRFYWTWGLFVSFTLLHLYANYRAVRALQLDQLNCNRAALVMLAYFSTGSIQTPKQLAASEPLILLRPGRDIPIALGAQLHPLQPTYPQLAAAAQPDATTGRVLLFLTRDAAKAGTPHRQHQVSAVLHPDAQNIDVLRACFQAELLAAALAVTDSPTGKYPAGVPGCSSEQATDLHELRSVAASWAGGGLINNESVATLSDDAADLVLLEALMGATGNYSDKWFDHFIAEAAAAGWVVTKSQLKVGQWRAEWHFDQ